jgi:zinc protease
MELPDRGVRTAAFPADRRQVHVYLGHLGIRRSDPDYAALVVMDHILGTGPGFTNRISRSLRDEQGLAYSVSADIYSSAGLLPGTFTAYIGTSPEHVETAVHGFQAEIHRIQDKLVTKEELRVVQQYLLGSFILGYERASRRAGYLVSAELFDLPEDTLECLPREFAAITREDVRRAARKHLYPEACCLAASGPVTDAQLRKILAG